MRRLPLLLAVFLILCPAAVLAQGGANTDIITGRVLDLAGEPLPSAVVSATALDTGIRRTTLSNPQGRYTLIFPDGGGAYRLEVSHIGMRTTVVLVERGPTEDVMVADVRMSIAPIVLQEVRARGARAEASPETQERVIDGDWITLMPINPGDLAAVASLSAGVVGLEATDSIGSGGFSVIGQRPDLNHISLDGATFGPPRGETGGGLGIPAEAIRLTRVITNSYDVARGQFSGGQIASTTRGGTNRPQGTISYSLHEPRLQWYGDGSPFNRAYTQHRVSGGYGGPLIRDRLFYFGSAAVQHRSQDLQSLMQADAGALERLGAHPDSVARFLETLRAQGLSPAEPAASSRQLIEELSLFGRLDYTLSQRHSVMLRGDLRWDHRDGTRVSSLGLPHSGGNNDALGGGVMVGVTSRVREELINEFRLYVSQRETDQAPYFPVPEGRVRVTSELDDGRRSTSTLVFGGNRSLPVTSFDQSLEMSNELSRLIHDRHRVKLGVLLHVARSAQELSPVKFGSYSFESLTDFALNQPTSFNRSLSTAAREGGGTNAVVYLGDTWQAARHLQLTYGIRAEASHFARRPEFNPAIDSLFGFRTDQFPSEVRASPRFGFTYTMGADERGRNPSTTVRGGVGEYRGRAPFSLFSTALDATGLPDSQVQIVCVGDAVPVPAWDRYRVGAHNIPEACGDGDLHRPTSGRAPNVTLFASDFSAPRSWRTSVGVERRLSRHTQASAEATYNLGTQLYGVMDLNLEATPHFTLEEEGGRPVFVEAATVVPGSGRVSVLQSRTHPRFAQVLQLHSGLRSSATQFTLEVRREVPQKLSLRTSYTASWARDESSFSCCSALQGFGAATTAGDPNRAELGRSDFERRHSLQATGGLPIRPWLQLTLIGRAVSGAPFTPIVGADINGDGVRNDRAFLFDPATVSDTVVARGMSRLLERSPGRVRSCLEAQLGQIAERNSCFEPWHTSIELRLNAQPQLPGVFGRRLTASLASQNLLIGLDQLVNGTGSLRGWGQRSSPDATLLYPRGFDPVVGGFRYEVNERFGDPRQGPIPFGSPFVLHLEGRMELGPRARR